MSPRVQRQRRFFGSATSSYTCTAPLADGYMYMYTPPATGSEEHDLYEAQNIYIFVTLLQTAPSVMVLVLPREEDKLEDKLITCTCIRKSFSSAIQPP